MPNRVPSTRLTLPWGSPACLFSSTTAAWASGPSWEAAAPQCVGRLQWVAALDAPLAAPAAADVDVELPVDGRARYLDLVLLIDPRHVDGAPTRRASIGERCLVDFVDLLRSGWGAVGFGAVVGAGLAAGLLRLASRRPLGERGGLPFAGAPLLVEQAG